MGDGGDIFKGFECEGEVVADYLVFVERDPKRGVGSVKAQGPEGPWETEK